MIDDPDIRHFQGASGFMESAPKGDFFDAHKVRIAWNTDDDGRVIDVFLTDDFEYWLRHSDSYHASGGDCYAEWMVPLVNRKTPGGDIPDQAYDPAGTFGTLLSHGFATKGALRGALLQFAQIDNCEWARRMLFAIEGELIASDLRKLG
jgi:hypothetical protein